jgi:hypothetical protein
MPDKSSCKLFTLSLHDSRGKGAEKTLHDDFVLICIHLTATSQSVHSFFVLVDHRYTLKVSQSKTFFISLASPGLFSMQHARFILSRNFAFSLAL